MDAAHVYFHFALGLLLGGFISFKKVLETCYHRRPLSPALAWWIGSTYCGGLFAIVPSVCRMAQLPEAFCRGWWMNIFVLHPLVDQWMAGRGLLIGELLIIAIFGSQYMVILLAIIAARRKNRSQSQD
jgi:hypothetical protein